jgi:hypothetical protein
MTLVMVVLAAVLPLLGPLALPVVLAWLTF